VTLLPVREKSKKQLRVVEALQAGRVHRSAGLGAASTATKMEGVFKKAPDRDEFGCRHQRVADRRTVFALR